MLLVLGAGGHARPVIEALRAMGLAVAGLLDDAARAPVLGVPILGKLDSLGAQGASAAVIAIGDNAMRARLGAACQARGLALPAVIHPTALISPSARIGAGVQVMARAVIGPEATLGDFALVNTGAIVEHECTLGPATHLGPGAVLCGGVAVGARALLGAGAVVRAGCRIGAEAVIGAGAAVTQDVAEGARMGGVPARPI
ncbi:MAG: hypothetical protein RLZZ187_1910 [Pseudomonadota bacterium]